MHDIVERYGDVFLYGLLDNLIHTYTIVYSIGTHTHTHTQRIGVIKNYEYTHRFDGDMQRRYATGRRKVGRERGPSNCN